MVRDSMSTAPADGQHPQPGEEAFRLGAGFFSRGEIEQAVSQLEAASARDHAGAQNLLGLIYLNGIGVDCRHAAALELIRRSASLGAGDAQFNLSGMLFNGFGSPPEAAAAVDSLQHAAANDFRAALRVLGLLYTASATPGSEQRAEQCFQRAALLGDIHGMYFAGRSYGEAGLDAEARQDRLYWLSLAAQQDLPCAVAGLAAVAEPLDARQLESLSAKHKHAAAALGKNPVASFARPDLEAPTARAAHDRSEPVIQSAHAVTGLFCDYLVHLAFRKLQPSSVIDPVTGQGLRTVLRTSYSMNFMPSMYDMAVGMLCSRMAALVGVPAKNAEPLVVLKYLPGQEYKPHFDYVPDTTQRGQRIATVLLYLNQPEAGGETDFPRLGVRVTPQRAKAIGFYNCDVQGAPDSRTLHAGLPVTQGEKWLATLWFRERPYDWST
jgi:prolyl 4-hydroxylase